MYSQSGAKFRHKLNKLQFCSQFRFTIWGLIVIVNVIIIRTKQRSVTYDNNFRKPWYRRENRAMPLKISIGIEIYRHRTCGFPVTTRLSSFLLVFFCRVETKTKRVKNCLYYKRPQISVRLCQKSGKY